MDEHMDTDIDPVGPEASLTGLTRSGAALPRVLDPVVTMDLVQRYVETERLRSRRALVWISTVFLLVVLLVFGLFVTVGIFVLGNTRESRRLAGMASAQTALYAAEVTGLSGNIAELEQSQKSLESDVATKQAEQGTRRRALHGDLKRFSAWVSSLDSDRGTALEQLEARLLELETLASNRESELRAMTEEYSNLVARSSTPSAPIVSRPAAASAAEVPVSPGRAEASSDDDLDALMAGKRPAAAETDSAAEQGALVFPNGDRYEGAVSGGMMNGWGVYSFQNGDRYEGEFRADVIDGRGTLLHSNGNKYAGDFKNGAKDGEGLLQFKNGDLYKGDFQAGHRSGTGTYIFANGAKYIGRFNKGKRDGEGRYIYPSGDEYTGSFKNGMKHGKGQCIYRNGRRINGLWVNDQLTDVTEVVTEFDN